MRTYAQAKADLWAHLESTGWSMSSPTLKVPHATSPDGGLRLWFKPQAIWFSNGNYHDRPAHSLWMDVRKAPPEKFINDVTGAITVVASKRFEANGRRDPLRHVRLDGYTLQTWDTGRTDRYGKSILAYEFRKPNGAILFEGEDFHVPPSQSIDSDESLRSLLGFLTLRPGDTDREYFDNYTKEQMAFARGDAEQLQMYTDDEYGAEFENLDDFEPNASFRFGRGRKFGEPPTKGRYYVEVDPEIIVEVKDYAEASTAVRLYIERTGMGSSEWYSLSPTIGRVTFGSKSGNAVARVSYNGRVWTPNEKKVLREAAR